jgi:hypothetical protein
MVKYLKAEKEKLMSKTELVAFANENILFLFIMLTEVF